MSDNLVDSENLLKDLAEQDTTEQQQGLVDGANISESLGVETDSQSVEEEVIEPVELSQLVKGEPKELKDTLSEKEKNKLYAQKRIANKKIKELETQLEQVKAKGYEATQAEKPKRTDFVNSDVIYDKYNGDSTLAMAAYEDAVDEFNHKNTGSVAEFEAKQAQEQEAIQQQIAFMQKFDESADAFRPMVKDFDANLEKSMNRLSPEIVQGIHNISGENTPLVIGAMADDGVFQMLDNAANPSMGGSYEKFVRKVSEVENLLKQNLPKPKTVSSAEAEVSVGGSANSSDVGKLKAEMQKAADSGDVKRYQELKKLLKSA